MSTPDHEQVLDAVREERERLERIAESDLPYAPYAERVLRELDQEKYEGDDDA